MPQREERAPLQDSAFHMADVRRKRATARRAVAVGELHAGSAFDDIVAKRLPKGDAIAMAEIAGLQGAKNASQLMPLCHPLPLEYLELRCEPVAARQAIRVYCEVATCARTGVEMEALAGVNAALLTLYDLTKPVQPALAIGGVRLLFKEGGKKGLWLHPDGLSEAERAHYRPQATPRLEGVPAAVITLSDRAHRGEYEDVSGPLLVERLRALGADVGPRRSARRRDRTAGRAPARTGRRRRTPGAVHRRHRARTARRDPRGAGPGGRTPRARHRGNVPQRKQPAHPAGLAEPSRGGAAGWHAGDRPAGQREGGGAGHGHPRPRPRACAGDGGGRGSRMSHAPLDPAEALRLILAACAPLPAHEVPAAAAMGRVLAAPVSAPGALPPFDNSAMDGYALGGGAEALAAGSEWPIEGEQAAGDGATRARRGAWEIMTGARLPDGLDRVIPVEQTERLEAPPRVRLLAGVAAGENVRTAGSDVAMGATVLAAGCVLAPQHLMLLAALGVERVTGGRTPARGGAVHRPRTGG